MVKKSGSMTLEMLLEQMEARFEKIEVALNINNKKALDREITMEERILRSVNDQVDATMARVKETTIRELMEKIEYIEVRVGQQIGKLNFFT
jgi:hypothetical protein